MGRYFTDALTLCQTTNFRLFLTESLQTTIDLAIKVFDKNGNKFSKSVENTVGKGEIDLNERFLLFPHCFQMTSSADT